jgi:hypothetical protein
MVQSTHPNLDAVFRRSGPKRILEVAGKTIERIRSPVNVGEALTRHTWFSRMFELSRTDVFVQLWSGSARYLGEEPPSFVWPKLRRVTETRTPRSLMDLPTSGSAASVDDFTTVTEAFLRKTPLTDIATCHRTTPAFAWSHESLALAATRSGRTIANRALSALPEADVDRALGRATRQLFAQKAVRALLVATVILRDRALGAASLRLGKVESNSLGPSADQDDASFAVGVGALMASHWLVQTGGGFPESERRSMLAILAPAASTAAAKEVRALLG